MATKPVSSMKVGGRDVRIVRRVGPNIVTGAPQR